MTPAPTIEPRDIGLPPIFTSWRPGQLHALERTADSTSRFIAGCMPTGSGKSVYAVAAAILLGVRTCVLTSTKILQEQYSFTFAECGMTDIRGRHNYRCPIARDTTCADGRLAGCKNESCPRALALKDAKSSTLVITNYDCFMHSYATGEGLGDFGLLIMDEAHHALDELTDFLTITIDHTQNEHVYAVIQTQPPHGKGVKAWTEWGARTVPAAKRWLDDLKQNSAELKTVRIADRFHAEMQRLTAIGGDWILDEDPGVVATFSPLWPTQYAEKLLFRNIEKVILLSATLVRKTLDLLGIAPESREMLEQIHSFDPNHSPVYLFGPSRIDYRSTEGQLSEWVARMDMLISRRLDRKGIIHSVSYARQKEIVSRSSHSHLILSPASYTLASAVAAFRESPPPKLIASPALTTGYDFPYRDAEYQFVMKMPFIDARSKILKARSEADADYLPWLTASTLMQTCGRIMRAPNDQGETIILDQHANWFLKRHRALFTDWFLRQVRYPTGPPIPPPALPEA